MRLQRRGFGGKSDPFNHEVVVAKLAMMTPPVQITLTEKRSSIASGRHRS